MTRPSRVKKRCFSRSSQEPAPPPHAAWGAAYPDISSDISFALSIPVVLLGRPGTAVAQGVAAAERIARRVAERRAACATTQQAAKQGTRQAAAKALGDVVVRRWNSALCSVGRSCPLPFQAASERSRQSSMVYDLMLQPVATHIPHIAGHIWTEFPAARPEAVSGAGAQR